MATNEERIDGLEGRLRILEVSRAQHDAWSSERDAYITRELTTHARERESMWAEIGKLKWNRSLVVAILTFFSSIIGSTLFYFASRATNTNHVPAPLSAPNDK